jgi:predicted GNAT family acetyltransferase
MNSEEIDDLNSKLDSIEDKIYDIDKRLNQILEILNIDQQTKKIQIDHTPEWP